ncbi:MAG: alanyl-tRNA editing protein [Anaerolineaceae bacterium]|nr:alanyl-tRNA editing protein [Anaerolineaceae bacterium]MDE0329967.1 alanyl-tRNA editing protein [Anaerolineaceae bacterium]
MTEALYLTDSYLRCFKARVVAVHEELGALVLDQSAFYPGGGGQPGDVGVLRVNDQVLPVTQVKRGHIHVVDGTLPPEGAEVLGELDWDRRYQLMRTHSAMHVLCGVVWRDYGASVTGGNMQPLRGRMDFEFERMEKELVAEIEAAINVEVDAERDIRINTLPREDAFQIPDLVRTKINLLPEGIPEVRTVEIVGLDLQADGGTHVANTREIGPLRIAEYRSKGRINKRITLQL